MPGFAWGAAQRSRSGKKRCPTRVPQGWFRRKPPAEVSRALFEVGDQPGGQFLLSPVFPVKMRHFPGILLYQRGGNSGGFWAFFTVWKIVQEKSKKLLHSLPDHL